MVTPNTFTASSTIFDFETDSIRALVPAGNLPIATGITSHSRAISGPNT